jgi:DNA (cytosine-5)-methyltransferase 1
MLQLDEQQKKALNGYRYIDLFCGIGGFHLALSSFGADCVFASDIKQEAKKVYANNFGLVPQGDITKIAAEKIPPHEILCGGFPCQPFSVSGHGKGFEDKNGKLFFEIIRIAKHHKPQVIFLENVANLEKHDNPEKSKSGKKIRKRQFDNKD